MASSGKRMRVLVAVLFVTGGVWLLWHGRSGGMPALADRIASSRAGDDASAVAATQGKVRLRAPGDRDSVSGTDPERRLKDERRAFVCVTRVEGTSTNESETIRLAAWRLDTSRSSPRGWLTQSALAERPRAASAAAQSPTARGTLPYLVQFTGPIQESWKQAVTAAGGVLRGYMPNFAFVVEMTDDALDRVAALPPVRWIGPFFPEYKVQPFLQHAVTNWVAWTAGPSGDGGKAAPVPRLRVSIVTFASEDVPGVSRAVAEGGGSVTGTGDGTVDGLVRAAIPASMVASLAVRGEVAWVEEYVPPVLYNDYAVQGRHLNATNVWLAYGLTGSNQVIGHADTGLDIGSMNGIHPDFAGRVKAAFALGRANDWSDPDGHGTHTAGSILGGGQASGGQYRGVAWQAQLVHQSVMDASGALSGIPNDLNTLFLQSYTNGARVHSDSWGSSQYGAYDTDSRNTDLFVWNHPDMRPVFAAGNDGMDTASPLGVIDPGSVGTPGTAKNVLTVGAAESERPSGTGGLTSVRWGDYIWGGGVQYLYAPIASDPIDRPSDGTHQGLAAFSSRGPCLDTRIKPDIAAPGTDVISCRSRAAVGTGWGLLAANTNYLFDGGTSMACPLTAGAAALVRQYYTDLRGLTNPSAALIKATLVNGARTLSPGQYGSGATQEIPSVARPNNVEGWGQADLKDTLFPAVPARLAQCDTNRLATGGTNTFALMVTATNRLAFTLAYSDYPGTAGAGVELDNDLDLVVVTPGGVTLFPNGKASADRRNNVEGVDISQAVSGIYTVRVAAYNVPNGPQPYALVVSGGWDPLAHTPLANTGVTSMPYAVDATLTALGGVDTNRAWVFWNTTGATTGFQSNRFAAVTGHVYRAEIPAQPTNTTVYYYLEGFADGMRWRNPVAAPASRYSFQVLSLAMLTVQGAPSAYGTPVPGYGPNAYVLGSVVTAAAPAYVETGPGVRQACTGWVGTASVPARGADNIVSFTLTNDSTLTWQWAPSGDYGLVQSASVGGILATTTWWQVGATGQTVSAPVAVTLDSTNYRFAQWTIDGVRQPDATRVAVNPAGGVAMGAPHTAIALYLPADQDTDGDGMADCWEMYYFGAIGVTPGADADGDGYTILQEFLDGSDPTDPISTPAPPAVTHTPLSNPRRVPAPWAVLATVTGRSAIASVTLTWSRNGGVWQGVPMTGNGMPNQFSNAIPAPGTNGDAFSYRIEAIDQAGVAATNGPYTFSVVYPLLVVTPAAITNVWVAPGTSVVCMLTVSNAGGASLAWQIPLTTVGSTSYVNNVESGTNGWQHGGAGDLWHISTNRYASATHAWYCGTEGVGYANNMNCWLSAGPFLAQTGTVLSFKTWYFTQTTGNDRGYVDVSSNGFSTFTTVLGPFIGPATSWALQTTNLAAFAGANVQVRFRFTSDNMRVREGWYVDDLAIGPVTVSNVLDWVTLSPAAGTLDPGAATNVAVTFSALTHTNGDVMTALPAIANNDPTASGAVFPLGMIVGVPPPVVRLTIVSAYGPTLPEPGTYTSTPTTVIACTATDVVTFGTTQFVCLGWSGTGSVGSGTGTSLSVSLTNDSLLAWNWGTNVLVSINANGAGSTSVSRAWLPVESNLWVTAIPAVYWAFADWGGDTSGCVAAGSQLDVPGDGARSILAVFAALLATNGTPQWWLASYGLTNGGFDANALADPDRDGMSTWAEYAAGTDPTNARSVLSVSVTGADSSGDLVLRWPSVSNRTYALDRTTNRATFVFGPLVTNIPASPLVNVYTDQVQGLDGAFYRVRLDTW